MWEKVKAMSYKKGFKIVYDNHAFSLVNFLVWFSSLDREATKPYPHLSMEDEEGDEARESIMKEDRGKKKKESRAIDKRCPRERMLNSDDLLFVSRGEVKQRRRNVLCSNEEEFGGKVAALENYIRG